MGRRLAWLIVAVAALAAIVWLLRDEARIGRSPSLPPTPGHTEDVPAPVAEPDVPEPDALRADVEAAAGASEPAAAAAMLRELLRTDAAVLRRAEAMLLDPATPRDQRIVLAVVLGTIGDSDPVLLEALRRFAGDTEIARALLLGLGAARDPPDDDEIFDLGDRPWGVRVGPLGITVRRTIEDGATRAALAAHLQDLAAETRLAAAQALRHSVASEDVRAAFVATLDREADDDVALEMGEALAGWAAGAAAAERRDTVRRLLARAGSDGLDGYRFRLEDDLARVPLGGEERARLEEYARPTHPLSVRAFALTVLAGGAEKSGAVAEARALLESVADADPDRAARDLAARLLPRLPYDEGTAARLTRIARGDPEWSLRYTAVESLAAFGGKPEVLDALAAAAGDGDERVAGRARELRARLSR